MNNSELIMRLIKETGVTINFTESVSGSDFPDSLFTITGKSLGARLDAFNGLVQEQIRQLQTDQKVEVKICIPDSSVASLIGRGGRNVETIQRSSHTAISVIDKIPGLKDRIVKVDGLSTDIQSAVTLIYNQVHARSPSPERSRHKMPLRFVIPPERVRSVLGKSGSLARVLKSDFHVDLRISEGSPSRDQEAVAVMNGKLRDCQEALSTLLEKLQGYDGMHQDPLKIQVPQHLRSVLIGQSSSSRMSNIKALPRTNDSADVTFEISGSKRSKIEALSVVLEVIEDGRTSSPPRKASPRARSPKRQSPPLLSTNITVPDVLVARLIGRNGEYVRSINERYGCNISFQKPVSVTQTDFDIKMQDGRQARICTFKGSPSSISDGLKVLLERIVKLERQELA
jgi:predicted RNA-binding protein YlqC (UPF0109 family)